VENEGGGILTLWRNHVFKCLRVEEGKGYIATIGEYTTGQGAKVESVGLINVYSSCSHSDKIVLWDTINTLYLGIIHWPGA